MSVKKHKYGDVRKSDGRIFVSYKNLKRADGTPYVYEEWLKPETFKKCKISDAKWRKKNREKLRQKMVEYHKTEDFKKKRKNYIQKNKDRIQMWMQEYYQKPEVKRRINEYAKKRKKTDPQYAIKSRMICRIYSALRKRGVRKSNKTIELIGCSYNFLRKHIESQFKEGMSWNNGKSFDIDHIKPLASFDLTDPEQLKAACHWTNLQPLTPTENRRKGAKCQLI